MTLVYTLFVSFSLEIVQLYKAVVTPIYSEVDVVRVLEIVNRFKSEILKQVSNMVNYHRSHSISL